MVGIRELARHLEISIGTVSRALNDRADVNPLTRQRVRDAAAKLGYSPNQSGRSLRRGQTDLIGVIIPGGAGDALINMVFLYVLAGLRQRLSQEGLDLAIFLDDRGADRLEALRRVTERGLVDAVIIADTAPRRPARRLSHETRQALRRVRAHPGRGSSTPGSIPISKPRSTAPSSTRRLGHRRIALSLQDVHTNYVDIVGRTYRRAMRRWGLATRHWELRRPPGERGGLAAAEALLKFRSEADGGPDLRFDACRRALPPPRRSRDASRPRSFDRRDPSGSAGAIAHSGVDQL